MNNKVIKTLEFDKIIEELSTYSSTYIGRTVCFNTKISTKIQEIQDRLNKTSQTQSLILKKGNIPLSEINDISKCLKKCEISGILNFKELLDVAHVLKLSREIKEYMYNESNFDFSKYIDIIRYFENIYCNIRVENLILDNILDEQTINDKASTELFNIRKSIKQTENRIRDSLNNYITSPYYSKYIQEPVITIRNDRFVIPVKQEYKSNIPGLVHDTSASGSTLFIEPNNIIKMNNTIKELKNDENIEIERICYNYSLEVQKISSNLLNNLTLIGILDFLQAKAKFSLQNDMYEPQINNNKYINLIQARHPLIPLNKVVPISLEITNEHNCMIITGPNTGGKTVTLKTIGLLTLMTQYGMHIPAKSGSSICIFNNIFTDIGDEQSIEQNLSTFSSHMTNIINITKNVTDNSLVIIDELGSGTDPIEGSALAIGILEYLNQKNCITLCTTHYSELKVYAMSKPNILNACTEFNIKTLKPTYHLILGIPGKSNAFAICERLGLDKTILSNSSKYIAKNNIDFEKIISKINSEKIEIEKLKKNTQSEYSKSRNEREKLENEIKKFENKKNELLNKAKQESKQLLIKSKDEINKMIDEIYQSKNKDKKDIQNAKTKFNRNINDKISDLSNNRIKEDIKANISITDLKIGQDIYIPHLNKNANILSITNSENILVQIGIIKTNLSINQIQLIDKLYKSKKNIININIENKAQNIHSSINVLGKTVEEAIYEIDKYLDDAYLSKIGIVTIIHGKGTGKLKDGIHTYLQKNKHIKSFRLGNYNEGQNGVTIVELKY